jgi:hypothetical protein
MFAASKKRVADVGPAPDNDEVFEEVGFKTPCIADKLG